MQPIIDLSRYGFEKQLEARVTILELVSFSNRRVFSTNPYVLQCYKICLCARSRLKRFARTKELKTWKIKPKQLKARTDPAEPWSLSKNRIG